MFFREFQDIGICFNAHLFLRLPLLMILGMSKSIHQIPAANLAAVKPIPNIKGSNHINNLSRRRRH